MTCAAASLDELATGGIGRLLVKYSWPALVAMSLNALYAVVDRVFIGQGCGVDAMAGLQLAMPVVMFLAAFGPLVGVGHAAVLSIKLGEGDFKTCEKLVGQTVALTREPAFASQCVQCGRCEKHCPQGIPIREKLKEADKALRPLPIRLVLNLTRRFMLRRRSSNPS